MYFQFQLQGDVFVEQFKERGYHPSALLNFMMFCGVGQENTVFGDEVSSPESVLKEISKHFSLDKVTKESVFC